MRHLTAYHEPGIFAGWPANHGAWQWGDEFLVGFIRGKHNVGGMHNVKGRLQKVFARSLDGGEMWAIEEPNVDFEAREVSAPPPFDLSQSIIRVCGVYDHGGEKCVPAGGFYLSLDRGHKWHGAFSFDGLERMLVEPLNGKAVHCTSRTRVMMTPTKPLVFLSAAKRDYWGSDFTFCATHDGRRFRPRAIVCADAFRAVMPATAVINSILFAALRRKTAGDCWIDCFASYDGGGSWRYLSRVGETGNPNGNPPALIDRDGVLYCAYADRTAKAMMLARSDDFGETWQAEPFRHSADSDIGYPQLFKRSDGNLVCVYYWTDSYEDCQRIEATVIG